MGQRIAMTRKCSQYVTPSIRNQVTQALVLSYLGYCMTVCSSAPKKHIKKQNRAARLALNYSFKTNVTMMHCSLAWLTIEAKITSSLLMFI